MYNTHTINPGKMLKHDPSLILRFTGRRFGFGYGTAPNYPHKRFLLSDKDFLNTDIVVSNEHPYHDYDRDKKGWVLFTRYDTRWGRLYIEVWRD